MIKMTFTLLRSSLLLNYFPKSNKHFSFFLLSLSILMKRKYWILCRICVFELSAEISILRSHKSKKRILAKSISSMKWLRMYVWEHSGSKTNPGKAETLHFVILHEIRQEFRGYPNRNSLLLKGFFTFYFLRNEIFDFLKTWHSRWTLVFWKKKSLKGPSEQVG